MLRGTLHRMALTHAWLRLAAGGQNFALPADAVAEVLPWMELCPIPASPSFVVGLLLGAGGGVPVVSLARLLGLPDPPMDLSAALVVIRGSQTPLALAVPKTEEVLHIDATLLVPVAPEWAFHGVVSAQFHHGGVDVLCLDPARLLLEREQQALADFARREQERLESLAPFEQSVRCNSESPVAT